MSNKKGSFDATTSDSNDRYELQNGNTGKVEAGVVISDPSSSNPVVTFDSGTTSLTNFGEILSTADRALYASGLSAGSSITVTNEAGGEILGSFPATGASGENNDAFKVKSDFSGGSITVNNSGYLVAGALGHVTTTLASGATTNITLASGASTSGQALDFDDIVSSPVTITNFASGVIGAADNDAIRPGADATIYNYGEIIAKNAHPSISSKDDTPPAGTFSSGDDAIDFQDHISGTAIINNYQGGLIEGGRHGITGKMAITVDNAGTIEGDLGSGINLDNAPGENGITSATAENTVITNEATGVIVGNGGTNGGDGWASDGDGIDVDYTVTVTNYGKIEAAGQALDNNPFGGVRTPEDNAIQEAITIGGGTIINKLGGIITSDERAITVDDSNDGDAYTATTITNYGTIEGQDSPADGNSDGGIGAISITSNLNNLVTNEASGTITGSILFNNSATDTSFGNNEVDNAGTITGSITFSAGNDTFNAYTGSSVAGTIDGGDGNDVMYLLLGSGVATGMLGSVTGFERLNVDGGTWTASSATSFIAANLAGGILDVDAVGGAGTGDVNFLAGAQTLKLENAAFQNGDFGNVITGFGTDDKIDLAGIGDATRADIGADGHSVVVSGGAGGPVTLHFDPAQSFAGMYFHLGTDGGSGLYLTESGIACFCRGTLIMTDRGERPVESLAIGDRIMTAGGRERPIKWIGRRAYGGRYIIGRTDILPICIRAGALDEAVPRRDLWISPHHAMLIDGVLVEARDLVNGVSIVQAEHVERVEYFHLELDSHDVIIAEGALSETFVDDDSRGMFHNADEYALLYPEAVMQPARYCAPRLNAGFEVEAIRKRLASRADVLVRSTAAGLRAA